MEGEEYAFVEAIRDSYLFQHITEPTRGRGSTEPHILDLVFMNEEGMVENINHQSPLGKSDHCVIECDFNCNSEEHQRSYKKYYYDKGDYEGMRNDLNIDWEDYLGQDDDIETQWNKFLDIVKSAQEKYIPSRAISTTSSSKKAENRLDKDTKMATNKKHRSWQRYIETGDDKKYREFCKQSKKDDQKTKERPREENRK